MESRARLHRTQSRKRGLGQVSSRLALVERDQVGQASACLGLTSAAFVKIQRSKPDRLKPVLRKTSYSLNRSSSSSAALTYSAKKRTRPFPIQRRNYSGSAT